MKTPVIKVGVLFAPGISFELHGIYYGPRGLHLSGLMEARLQEGKIDLLQEGILLITGNSIVLQPLDQVSGRFTLRNVVIGINFHWERKEDQVFKGGIQLLVENEKISAINLLSVEEYLTSVISSEMSATSSVELLKAHAVISRSWLLAQVEKNKAIHSLEKRYISSFESEDEILRWYDREDHINFDVCADDHCQRYQGITRTTTQVVANAVNETHGEILEYKGAICDARYSKCCGGVAEVFENVWEPVIHPYLQKVIDNPFVPEGFDLNLENEEAATEWIMGSPAAFCNSSDKEVLTQVLNNYDQETNDFFRWQVIYSQQELSELIRTRTGIDFGTILELIPVERGVSARLVRLKIIGTQKTMIIGKELEIRKALSASHLYSSAFIIEKELKEGEVNFILKGAGWGHGVGLCQIGAAMMGAKGYTYKEILFHYFRGAELKRRY